MGMGSKLYPFINPKCGQIGRPCPDNSNPIYGCGVKIAPDINPIYAGFERYCPRDSKNVSYVDVELVQTCLDLIEC